jgi:hypothetical protein
VLENPVYPALLHLIRRSSDNATGADNQQERLRRSKAMLNVKAVPLHIGYYLAGFADGEGSFNISFRPRGDYRQPWKVSLCFNISQKDKVILALFKQHLKCGTMRSREDGVWYYEVNNLTAICENVIPFFKRFGFLSAKKKRDFAKFIELAELMSMKRHLALEGIKEILKIRKEMNDGGKRRYDDAEILNRFWSKESSETIRQIPVENGK